MRRDIRSASRTHRARTRFVPALAVACLGSALLIACSSAKTPNPSVTVRSQASEAPSTGAAVASEPTNGSVPCPTIASPPDSQVATERGEAARLAPSAWPAFQHDARHSSSSAAVGPQDATLRWRRRLEGGVTPAPVIGVDGTIYAASNGGVLHALDPATGEDRWTFDGGGGYGSDLSTAPAVLADGTILWPGPRDTLFGLDAAGTLLWSRQFGSFLLSPAITAGGSIAIAEMSGALHMLDITSNGVHERWSSDLGGSGTSYGSPAIGDDGTIFATAGNRIVALRDEGDRGEILWHFDIGSGTEVSPAVGRTGISIFGTNDDFEYGVDAEGRELWRYPRKSLSYSSPAVTDGGLAYFGDHNGYMNVVEARSGCLVRRYKGSDEIWTAPAIDAKGNVYFGTKDGHIFGFAFNGAMLLDIATGATVDSYPAIAADGTLIIGSSNGTLYAIGR